MSGTLIIAAALATPSLGDVDTVPVPYKQMVEVNKELAKLFAVFEPDFNKQVENLRQEEVRGTNLSTKMMLAGRLVRLADKTCREARQCERAFQKLSRQIPREQQGGLRAIFDDQLKRLYRYKSTSRKLYYLAFLGHRWPWESKKVTPFNYTAFMTFATICHMRNDLEPLLDTIGYLDAHLTRSWPWSMIEVVR
jgi:hypothetical protein